MAGLQYAEQFQIDLSITDACRARNRKAYNNGDNRLAKQVPKKRMGGG